MKKIFQSDESYRNNLQLYIKKDGWLALALYGIFLATYSILALLELEIRFVKDNILLMGMIANGLLILIAFLFVKLRKQNLASLGLIKGNWKKSLTIGLILGGILAFNNGGFYL